jgi:hypothetical protein
MCKLPKSSLLILVDQMVDLVPAWKGRLLHRSGCLSLINSTLAAISVYTTMSQELPTWLLHAFEKIFKAFLWTGSEAVHGGKCLVAWSRVQQSLKLGGLEVPDMKQMGKALHLCWLLQQRVELGETMGCATTEQGRRDQGILQIINPVYRGGWTIYVILA